jgi:hypothetical protein
MRVWIELDEEGSAWRQTRRFVAWLTRAGYVAQVLNGPEPKVLVLSGHRLVPAELENFGHPPGHNDSRERSPDPAPGPPGHPR